MYDQQLPSYPGYPPTQSGACPMPMPTISQNQLRNNSVTSQNSVLSDVSIFSGMLRGKSSDDLQAILHNESKIISMIGEVDEVSSETAYMYIVLYSIVKFQFNPD